MGRLFLLILFFLASCSTNPNKVNWYGAWRVTSEVSSAAISGMSDEQIDGVIGKELRIDENKISLLGAYCGYKNPVLSSSAASTFLGDYKLAPDLSFPSDASMVSIECVGDLFLGDFVVAGDTLWFVWYGVLFQARKLPEPHS